MFIHFASAFILLALSVIAIRRFGSGRTSTSDWSVQNSTCTLKSVEIQEKTLVFFGETVTNGTCSRSQLRYFRSYTLGENFSSFEFLSNTEFRCQTNLLCTLFKEI